MVARKILIVEDEVIVALELSSLLEGWGYEVVGMVASAEEGIAQVERDPPHLILMDVRLRGEMDGHSAARLVHRRYGIPSVLVTAHGADAMQAGGVEDGIYGRVLKPYDAGELQQMISGRICRALAGVGPAYFGVQFISVDSAT